MAVKTGPENMPVAFVTSDLSISEVLNHEVDRCSSTVGQQQVRMLDSVGRGGD
jgi:hypothetical protein